MVRVALVREAAPLYTAHGPADVAHLARELLADRDRETFLVLCLDTKLRVGAVQYVAFKEKLRLRKGPCERNRSAATGGQLQPALPLPGFAARPAGCQRRRLDTCAAEMPAWAGAPSPGRRRRCLEVRSSGQAPTRAEARPSKAHKIRDTPLSYSCGEPAP